MSPAFTDQELQQLRADTPGTAHVTHFNNAGSSLPVTQVVKTVTSYLQEEAITGGYETEFKYRHELEETYSMIAELIGAESDEIALVENASVGWCIAFHGLHFKPGDEVIVSELEYVTNLLGIINAQKLYGIELKVVPHDEAGNFSLDELEKTITPRTKLIAVTHVASATGGVLPVQEIGRIAQKHGILYLLDACQSVGHIPVNVKAIGCDFLLVTGRKYLRAPRGTGFLYVKKSVQDKLKSLFIDGHSVNWLTHTDFELRNDARRFELYEKNRALTLGLAQAVKYTLTLGIDRIWQQISYLAEVLRNELQQIPGVTLHDLGSELCGIVTFTVEGIDAPEVKATLAGNGVNVSVGLDKSTLIFMEKHYLSQVVRASLHYYNTTQEIDKLCDVISSITSAKE